MNNKTIKSFIHSEYNSSDFDFIKQYDSEAKKSEAEGDFENAVKSYEYEICYLTKVYSFAISVHYENLKYPQTYNGKHFLETAQKWKQKIIDVHNHISDIVKENSNLFSRYEPINLDKLLSN